MRTTVYVHANKETMFENGERLGLKGEALKTFSYACYEVAIGLEVDTKTGDAKIVTVDGREVKKGRAAK